MRITIDNYCPAVKKRWRLGKNGNKYSPSKPGEVSLSWLINEAFKKQCPEIKKPIWGSLLVNTLIQVTDRTAKKLKGDLDNYIKFVWDALTKSGVIVDDCQIFGTVTGVVPGDCNRIIIIVKQYDPQPLLDIFEKME